MTARPLLPETFFFYETAEPNLMKLDRKQEFNVLNQLVLFLPMRKSQDDLLRLVETFWTSLIPLNGICQNLTGSKKNSKSQSLSFSGPYMGTNQTAESTERMIYDGIHAILNIV